MASWVGRTRACPRSQLTSLFHTSAPVSWSGKKRSFGLLDDSAPSSSTRSAPPESSKGRARAKPPPFIRDAVPHSEIEESSQPSHGRNPSFRRRSEARNELDWERRTGKWSTSAFGGGDGHGSRMGIREDRPSSYGLNESRLGAPQNTYRTGEQSRFGPRARPPSFGLRPLGAPPRRVELEREASSSPGTGDENFREPLGPRLKNRNQPLNSPSSSPVKTPPTTIEKPKPPTPPPKKESVVASLFYNPPVVLARAGVPIVSKSDPITASTTSSYSPSMSHRDALPTKFTSPPLLPGLLNGVTEMLGGPAATPTTVQALSLKWIVEPWTAGQENVPSSTALTTETRAENYKEYLLASETGSGKSIAYLLPVLQALKLGEARRVTEGATSKRGLNPRALILAPTHELARQLSGVAKALLHDVKLRVLCASRANSPARAPRDPTVAGKGKKNSNASRMKALLATTEETGTGEFQVKETDVGRDGFPVDIVVGTPMKIMEMIRGRGWEQSVEFSGGAAAAFEREQKDKGVTDGEEEKGPKRRRGRDSVPGVGKWQSSPEMGLSDIEWVVVDEADVLFDPDFQETTRLLLADISKARGHEVPFTALPVGLLAPAPPSPAPVPATSRQKEKDKKAMEESQSKKITVHRGSSAIAPLDYPFNLLLTSATIPNSLSTYLNAYHPAIQRFVSPNLHHLPKTLKPEYVNWTGGNKNADIERRLRRVWAADAAEGLGPVADSLGDMSKVIIFCNRNTKVNDLGDFLEEKGIKNVQLSSSSENRQRGNNKHLEGFLKGVAQDVKKEDDWSSSSVGAEQAGPKRSLVPTRKPPKEPINDPMHVPHVMITTSLLSRGLDFSPNVKHVFIVDEPRNMIDFLHRAGRTGRAGSFGKVVIFGKMEGRGSQRSKEVRKRVKAFL